MKGQVTKKRKFEIDMHLIGETDASLFEILIDNLHFGEKVNGEADS